MNYPGTETSPAPAPADSAPTLRIDGDLTVYTVGEWHARLTAAVGATLDQGALIDLSRVTEIDTAGLQLLLMAKRVAAARRRQFALLTPSPSARDLLHLCGLDHLVCEELPEQPGAPAGARS